MVFLLQNLKGKVFKLQYDGLGVFAANRYFHVLLQMTGWLCLWPFKWDKKTRRLLKENRLFKRILRFIVSIELYMFMAYGIYQFFYAEEYRNEPWFPNQGDHLMHLDFILIMALGTYCHISVNFGEKRLTDFVTFLQQFDHDNDGELVRLNAFEQLIKSDWDKLF